MRADCARIHVKPVADATNEGNFYMPLTEHEIKNIGFGYEPGAPLTYAVRVKFPNLICYLRASLSATSEIEALNHARRLFGVDDVKVTLL